MADEKKRTKPGDKSPGGKTSSAKAASGKAEGAKASAKKAPAKKGTKPSDKSPGAGGETSAKKAAAKAPAKTAAAKPAAKKSASKKAPAKKAAAKKPAAKKAKPKEEVAPPMVRARASYVRVAPRKARLVADQVRGLPIDDALTLLRFSPRTAARDIAKLIDSAAANAENNHDLVADDLVITDITVDEGPTLRRYRPRALGRATRINKRTSHIKVALTPED
jgi:ribosomal protein L22